MPVAGRGRHRRARSYRKCETIRLACNHSRRSTPCGPAAGSSPSSAPRLSSLRRVAAGPPPRRPPPPRPRPPPRPSSRPPRPSLRRRARPSQRRRRAPGRSQDRRRHRHRHAQRQGLQRVLLQGRRRGRRRDRLGGAAVDRPEGRLGVRRADIQSFVSQKLDIIVTVGFNLTADTVKAAKANPDIGSSASTSARSASTRRAHPDCHLRLQGRRQDPPAATTCRSDFQEDQAGYLAGIVAAASKAERIGAIGGTTLCAPCVRYIQGYELGAKSVKPDIKVVQPRT